MSTRTRIEQKIKKKKTEISEYESKVREAEASIQAFQEVLKFLPRDSASTSDEPAIREGSLAGKAIKVLRKAGAPLHINKLLDGCGIPKNKRQSLSGTLSHYVRKKEVFTRPSPGTFGLMEFDIKNNGGPPDDFGVEDDQAWEEGDEE